MMNRAENKADEAAMPKLTEKDFGVTGKSFGKSWRQISAH